MASRPLWAWREAGGVAKAARLLLYATAALSTLAAGAALAIGVENFESDAIGKFQLGRSLVSLATAITFFVWLYRANANVRALGAEDMMGSPGLGVGWFFIPLANLFMPYMTVRDVWRASGRPRDWQGESAPVTILLWWICWVAGNVLATVSFRIELEHGFKMTPEALWLGLLCDLLWIPASLLLASIIGGAQERQVHARLSATMA
ncbi:MAG TPA: DUF4328 domain-containing protein [Allosphingosinicella sp.]|nr:DUF4328 domain-containing protein [Allosphingosinicella sp.]